MNLHDDACITQDLPHLVYSMDPEEPNEGPMFWGILANHAEWLLAKEQVERYADETEGVEMVWVEVVQPKPGAQMAAEVAEEVAFMQNDPDLQGD